MVARVLAGTRQDLGGEQVHDRSVLVGRPDLPVAAEEAGAGALLAAEAQRAVEQARDEPLEADGDLAERTTEAGDHPVDQPAADEGLADRHGLRPLRPMPQQVADRHGQEMVRVHQPHRPGDDPVPVRVRVIAERQVEAILQAHEARHGVGARAVHPDLAVVVQGHEPEGRVIGRVGHRHVQAVGVGDRLPVPCRGAAQGVDSQPQPGPGDRVHIDDAP